MWERVAAVLDKWYLLRIGSISQKLVGVTLNWKKGVMAADERIQGKNRKLTFEKTEGWKMNGCYYCFLFLSNSSEKIFYFYFLWKGTLCDQSNISKFLWGGCQHTAWVAEGSKLCQEQNKHKASRNFDIVHAYQYDNWEKGFDEKKITNVTHALIS